MIPFGAVLVREGLGETFYARLRPISENRVLEALAARQRGQTPCPNAEI